MSVLKKILGVLAVGYIIFSFTQRSGGKYVVVNNVKELKKALKENRKQIFIPGNIQMNLTSEKTIQIPKGVKLFSDRTESGSEGALLYSDNFKTNPMFICEEGVTIKGIRFKGPDRKIRQKEKLSTKVREAKRNGKNKKEIHLIYVYGLPNSVGIKIKAKNVIVEDCEVFGWSHAGIYITYNATGVKIKNNFIHHNQRAGLGYGVLVQGEAEVFNNTFDYNRHAIASSGKKEASYHAHHNVCLENSTKQNHIFDVHRHFDKKIGDTIAGKKFTINDNIFFVKKYNGVIRISGKPLQISFVKNNHIYVYSEKDKGKLFVYQPNRKGNLSVSGTKVFTLKK